ncbi:LOW QUALITY PROTEIN: hypothetical protein Cgig2_012271 [Carnegiea gigantea]|uniref:Uncharacterized protein n=1 Tax=Carnegiea gigantea TaxID=171969 RepID=A0A9Q1K3A4_9CARY|nr:LOW QUALITY PROTEIN: hypothetical protein Cgig2_012271 [Carnegiea gigantea]
MLDSKEVVNSQRHSSEFESKSTLLPPLTPVRGYRRHYFSNHIRAFPNTPNYLTSRVDLLEPGSLDYGLVPAMGVAKDHLKVMIQAAQVTKIRDPAFIKVMCLAPILWGRRTEPSKRITHFGFISNSLTSHHGFGERRVHEHLTTSLNQGPIVKQNEYFHNKNSYS